MILVFNNDIKLENGHVENHCAFHAAAAAGGTDCCNGVPRRTCRVDSCEDSARSRRNLDQLLLPLVLLLRLIALLFSLLPGAVRRHYPGATRRTTYLLPLLSSVGPLCSCGVFFGGNFCFCTAVCAEVFLFWSERI